MTSGAPEAPRAAAKTAAPRSWRDPASPIGDSRGAGPVQPPSPQELRSRIAVRARPGARRSAVEWDPWRSTWVVAVTAPARAGLANQAILALLSERLGVSGDRIRFVRAGRSTDKVVEVIGLSQEQVRARLAELPR